MLIDGGQINCWSDLIAPIVWLRIIWGSINRSHRTTSSLCAVFFHGFIFGAKSKESSKSLNSFMSCLGVIVIGLRNTKYQRELSKTKSTLEFLYFAKTYPFHTTLSDLRVCTTFQLSINEFFSWHCPQRLTIWRHLKSQLLTRFGRLLLNNGDCQTNTAAAEYLNKGDHYFAIWFPLKWPTMSI